MWGSRIARIEMRGAIGAAMAACLVVASLVAVPPVSSEPRVVTTWREAEEVVAVTVDRGGRAYTAMTVSNRIRGHAVVRAYRADGSLRWERTWRPASASVHAWAITVGPGGDVIVAGSINHVADPGACDEIWGWGWAARSWHPDGSVAWQRLQPGWETCDVFGTSARAVDARGDTVALAVSFGHEYGSWGYVVAFDADGERRWRRSIDPPDSVNESVADVAVGQGGSVYVAATRRLGALDAPEHDQDAILVKLGRDGAVRWVRDVPDRTDLGTDDTDVGVSVAVGGSAVFFSSIVAGSDGSRRIRLAGYATDGTVRWHREVPRGAGSHEADALVGVWSAGVALASLEPNPDAGTHIVLRGYDPTGHLRWRHRVGPLEERHWGPTGMDARADTIVIGGRPARVDDWSRIWLLRA